LRNHGQPAKGKRTLAIDVGGTGIKAAVLDCRGIMLADRVRINTPYPCTPAVLVRALQGLAGRLPACDRVSVGFPGVIREGKVVTAPHFGDSRWRGFDLAGALAKRLRRPVRLLNDAEVHGFAAISGQGLELVVTLGTGVGTALYRDGALAPHLELAHHPVHGHRTYNEYIGERARRKCGDKKWSRRVRRVIRILGTLLNYDRIHIGGGNARHIRFQPDRSMRIISNESGILGGIALWRLPDIA
jgi:polyphosphate glucokinase